MPTDLSILNKTRRYVEKWWFRKGGIITEANVAALAHDVFLAGRDDKPLDWNEDQFYPGPTPVGELHWQDQFTKIQGTVVFAVVSEYSATKVLGLREGQVWVTDGRNVNLMPKDKVVMPLEVEE